MTLTTRWLACCAILAACGGKREEDRRVVSSAPAATERAAAPTRAAGAPAKPRGAPGVELDVTIRAGERDPEAVRARLVAQARPVRACVERARRRVPGLAGRMVVEPTVGMDGVVGAATVHEDPGEAELRECVLNRLRAPRHGSTGAEAIAVVTVRFTTGSDEHRSGGSR